MAIRKQTVSVTIAAGGGAAAPLTRRGTLPWTLLQVSVRLAAAPVGAAAELDLNGVFVTALIPTGDVADGVPSLPLDPSDAVTVVFTGCTVGQVGTVLFIYDDGL